MGNESMREDIPANNGPRPSMRKILFILVMFHFFFNLGCGICMEHNNVFWCMTPCGHVSLCDACIGAYRERVKDSRK
jgi:hypothetical protein